MTIYRGLNVTLYLGDVDNLNVSLNNLGLNINDLNRIRNLSNFITQKEFHLLANLVDDQEKATYSAYRSSFDVYQNINTLTDLYGLYKADAIVNNQIRASAIKYNFLQYDNTAAGFTVESADISTSRVSSWSNIDGTIFYGSNLEVNPNIGGGNYADNTESVLSATKIEFLGNITPKRFEAEVPTNIVRLNINGVDYEFFAMKNIPVSFDGFFKDLNLFYLIDGLGGTRPTAVIVDYTTDPATEYQYELGFGGQQLLATPRTGKKRIDFYYRPDGIIQLGIQRSNVPAFPEAILTNLEFLDLTQNIIPTMPNFAVYTPNLKRLILDGNPLSQGGVPANTQVGLLPQSLTELYVNGTFTDSSTIDLSNLINLEIFEFNAEWGVGNIRKSKDFGSSPIPSANLQFYVVRNQSFNFVPLELTQTLPEIRSINLSNCNIRGVFPSGASITLDTPKLIYLDLSKNRCQPVPLANNQVVETINHYDNYSFASDDISEYYQGCTNLRTVNFTNSNVRGDIGVLLKDINSMTTLLLENTRMSGTLAPQAFAAANPDLLDEDSGQKLGLIYNLEQLLELNLTKGLFSSVVDTNTNFFGNRLDPVQVSSGTQLIRAKSRIIPNTAQTENTAQVVFDLNSANSATWDFQGSGEEQVVLTFNEASLYSNIPSMQSNDMGKIEVVETSIKGNMFTDARNAVIVVTDPTNTDADSNRTSAFLGAAVIFNGNGAFIRQLLPRNVLYSYSFYGKNNRFGEAVAINSNFIFVGFPGRKNGFNSYSGGVEVYTYDGNHRYSIRPSFSGAVGSKLVANDTYLFALDAQNNTIWRYGPIRQNSQGLETSFASSSVFGANRTISDFKLHNNQLYVSVVGNNDSTTGAVYVLNQTSGAIDRVITPGNANNAPISYVNKYERYFGSLIQPVSVGNSEFVVVASNNKEPSIITSTLGEFANTNWTNAVLDNRDQIVISGPSTTLRNALNGDPSVPTGEIPDGTAIDVEWLNANSEPQFLTGYYLRRDQSTINDTGDIILDLDPGAIVHGFNGDFDGTITKISFIYDKYSGWGFGSTIELYDYETAQYTDSLPSKVPTLASLGTDFITSSVFDSGDISLANFTGAFKSGNFSVSDYVLNANTDIGTVIYSYPPWDERYDNNLQDGFTQFEVSANGTFINATLNLYTTSSSGNFKDNARVALLSAESVETQNLFNNFAIFEDKETQGSSLAFSLMPSLVNLKLGDNTGLGGKLPNLNFLVNIEKIDIFKTAFTGTVDLNGLNTLQSVSLQNNLFEGVFPDTLLPNLQTLRLNNNRFTSIGELNLPELEYLDLSANLFTGPIPSLASSPKLKDAILQNNQFTDYLSGTVSLCLSLRKLDLSNNNLTLQDAFRLLADLETNYNNNNRGGVNVILLGNAGISEALIRQNSVYSAKYDYLTAIAGWTILVN